MNESSTPTLSVQPKTGPLKGLDDLLALVDRVVKVVCVVLLGAMAITIFTQVFGRLILARPFSWTEELARYLMIWGAFIGASSMIRTWENVYVDFFIEKLPPRLKKAAYTGIKLVILVFMVYIMYITLNILPRIGMYQTTPALGISMFWAHLGMIIGLGLVTLQLLGSVLNALFGGGSQ